MAFEVTGNRTHGLVSGVGTTVCSLERNKKFPTLGRVPKIISKWIKELNFFFNYKNISKEENVFIILG